MTEENYNYRTSPFLLRNQFDGEIKFKIPLIPKTKFTDEDFKDLLLIGFDRTNLKNNNHSDQKEFFLKGYNEMLSQIEPERIICYNQPFPEMKGNIVFVDYELSSWKYQNDYKPSKYLPIF